jgi:hypothetical protein
MVGEVYMFESVRSSMLYIIDIIRSSSSIKGFIDYQTSIAAKVFIFTFASKKRIPAVTKLCIATSRLNNNRRHPHPHQKSQWHHLPPSKFKPSKPQSLF